MASQIVARNTLLASTAGVPVAADVITTINNVFVNPKAKSIETKDVGNGQAGNTKSQTITDWTTAEFNVDVGARTGGELGTPPAYGELFKMCGLTETITETTDVTYTPGTLTPGYAKAYLDGAVRTVTGVAADFTFGGNVGDIAKFTFSLKGFTDLSETVEANPAVALDANEKLIIESVSAITVSGSTVNMKSFEFSLGNEINEIYAIGRKEYYISDFKSSIKISAVKTKGNATHWSDLSANTIKEVKVVLGSIAGNIITFTAPYCNPNDVSESDSNGMVVYDNVWGCEASAGGDNFSIVYA